MGRFRVILFLVVVRLVVNSCTRAPERTDSGPASPQVTSSKPIQPAPTFTATFSVTNTPAQTFSLHLPEYDRIVFTIENPEPWTGKEGEVRPDWKAWGAESFDVAPDGSFWIADSAVSPARLLHYDHEGNLLHEVSLEGLVVFPYDLAVLNDGIWVLDISAATPRVARFDLDGQYQFFAEIDTELMTFEGAFISNGVDSLLKGERGELLLHGVTGYTVFINTTGEKVAQPLDSLLFFGHSFQIGTFNPATGATPIIFDGLNFNTGENFHIYEPAFLGFNPDGSFAITGLVFPASGDMADAQVRYYAPSGELLGKAWQREQTIHRDFNHHLAFGPDGSIFQLLSNPDHTVQMLQLGFAAELAPLSASPARTGPPLFPLALVDNPANDVDQAQNALVSFFSELSSGNHEAGAELYGGPADEFLRPPEPEESLNSYWGFLCSYLWCLQVAEITEIEVVAEDEYLFFTTFMHPDGARFEIGACCGEDPAARPPVWQFAFPVRRIDGIWQVMRPPLYTP